MNTTGKLFTIFTALTVTIVANCSAQPSIAGRLGVARACTEDTPQLKEVRISTIPTMESAGYGSFQCFEKGTQTELSIASVKVFKNKLGGGSVKVVFIPQDEIVFSKIAIQNKNKKLVVMNKNGAVFSIEIRYPEYGLLILGPDLHDAELTANAILGK